VTDSPKVKQRRPGRPSGAKDGAERTRARILAAAQTAFSEHGYQRTTIRAVAAAAGVDSALVHHYFGTKDALFLAAMQMPLNPDVFISEVILGDPAQVGERLVRSFLRIWGDPVMRQPLLILLRAAIDGEAGAELLRGFVSDALVRRVSEGLDQPTDPLRVTAAASQLVGLAIVRYVVRVEPLASASEDEVVALVGPVVQRHLAPGV
jgi:AcrR family transcriptional regulator